MAATGLVTITVPKDYGYVVLTATSTFALSLWHALRIGKYRRAAGIPYPHIYFPYNPSATATSTSVDGSDTQKQYLFNCAQRGQANFLESYPSVLAALLISGLQYPIVASSLGAAWIVARIAYAVGYTSPAKERGTGRLPGSIGHYLAMFGLYGTSFVVAYNLVRA